MPRSQNIYILKQLVGIYYFYFASTQSVAMPRFEELMQARSRFQKHHLDLNQSPDTILKSQQLVLVRQGELVHSSGFKLTAANIYLSSELPKDRAWRTTQSTEIYSLDRADWDALHHLPQLADLRQPSPLLTDTLEQKSDREARLQLNRGVHPKTLTPQKKLSKAFFPSPTVRVGHFWQRFTRRYPFFQQQSASDCGAACLVTIGRYWGKRFSVSRLRDIANVDRNGASLRGLAAAAESIGFTTRPVKASLDKLAAQNLPAIAHWEGRHFIVVYEIARDRIVVADPAISQRSLSHAAFKAG